MQCLSSAPFLHVSHFLLLLFEGPGSKVFVYLEFGYYVHLLAAFFRKDQDPIMLEIVDEFLVGLDLGLLELLVRAQRFGRALFS